MDYQAVHRTPGPHIHDDDNDCRRDWSEGSLSLSPGCPRMLGSRFDEVQAPPSSLETAAFKLISTYRN